MLPLNLLIVLVNILATNNSLSINYSILSIMEKNVLIVSKDFPPTVCGVGDYSNEIMKHLVGAGIKTTILTRLDKKDWYNVSPYSYQGEIFAVTGFSFNLYREIKVICTKHSIKTIFWQYVPYSFGRGGLPLYLPIVMFVLRLAGLRQVVYFHEISLRTWGHGLKQWLRAIGQQIISRGMAAISNENITSIPFYKRYLWPFYTHIVPVGANIYSGLKLPEYNGAAKSITIFCFANRVNKTVVDCIEYLRNTYPNKFQWIIAGKIESAGDSVVSHLVNNPKIFVSGVLPMAEIAALIESCDIFLQPNAANDKGEGGISAKNGTVIAAMAAGKPIIANGGDMTDSSLFIENHNVLLCKGVSWNDYAQAIIILGDNKGLRKKLGKAARETYDEKFCWDVVAGQIAEII